MRRIARIPPATRAGRAARMALAAVLVLAAGCDGDEPTGAQRFTATQRVDGELAISTQGTLRLSSPLGPVVILGEAVGPRIRWSLDKSVTGPSAPEARDHLDDFGLLATAEEDTAKIAVTVPLDRSTYDYVGGVTLGVPAAMDCTVAAAVGSTQVSFLSGKLDHIGFGPVTVRQHSGDCSVVTSQGDVLVEVALPLGGTCVVWTGDGDVEIRVPQDSSAQVNCSTGQGTITVVDLVLVDSDPEPRLLVGTLGAGDGAVSVLATKGNVTLRGF